MRRIFFAISFWLLAIDCVNAQEAFYIYRNDGDFNGFFYDEVVEMRYSHFGIDSVEHEEYVTYEIVLADTIHRIPLAAIDSIGFQQPEIKLNPKVKFMQEEGLCPYLQPLYAYTTMEFKNLPANLTPQVGDVLLGFASDDGAEVNYKYFGGSYGLVVERVQTNGNTTFIEGHPVDQLSDVFEQYITVERIGLDKQNNIVRRIAGCTPDGKPRKVKAVDGSSGDITIIDIDGTFNKSWSPGGSSSVDLSADVGIKFLMRASYNITWAKFFVKLSDELSVSIKPTISASLQTNFIGTPGFFTIPGILFPATCPIFETNPCPDIFLRAGGSLALKLNLPKVQLGFGEYLIIDADQWFPISYSMHMLPDDGKEPEEDMLDFSAEVNLSGFVQIGVEFQANICTASWFSRIFKSDIGLHLYVGPKLSGQVSVSSKLIDGWGADAYGTLRNSYIDFALLSLDLEAGAKVWPMWDDPDEITFLSKSWEFMQDTIRFAPKLGETTVEFEDEDAIITMRPAQERLFLASSLKLGVLEENETEMKSYGWWPIGMNNNDTAVQYTLKNLTYDKAYHVVPVISYGKFGDVVAEDYKVDFRAPLVLKMDTNELRFGAFDELKQELKFTTNAPGDDVHFYSKLSWLTTDSDKILAQGGRNYVLSLSAAPNTTVFDRQSTPLNADTLWTAPYFWFEDHNNYVGWDRKYFHVYQETDLSNVKVHVGHFRDFTINGTNHSPRYDGAVTATATDSSHVHLEGSYTDNFGYKTIYTINLDLERTKGKNGEDVVKATGILRNRTVYSTETWETLELNFDYSTTSGTPDQVGGGVSSASYEKYESNVLTVHDEFGQNDQASIFIRAETQAPPAPTQQ